MMTSRMQCVAAAASRATVMMVAMDSFKCFTATQTKMMLDLIRYARQQNSITGPLALTVA